MTTLHIPILVEPIVEALIQPFMNLPEGSSPHWIVDCTLGGGGHTAAFLKALEKLPYPNLHGVLALDQDIHAIEKAKIRFQDEIQRGRLKVIQSRFGEAVELVRSLPVLGLMADLGFSSDQLGDASRGLSFMHDGPLDMRLDPSHGQTCYDVLKEISEVELETWLREWGEERFSKRIASSIISKRRSGELPKTTKGLADIVIRAIPSSARHGKIHAATRTFQALRIGINEEMGELDQLLNQVIMGVKPGGRIAILSFHSLEDRPVKWKFKDKEMFSPLSKKAIQAGEEEILGNPRARSAKLRIVEKKC